MHTEGLEGSLGLSSLKLRGSREGHLLSIESMKNKSILCKKNLKSYRKNQEIYTGG